MGVMNEISYLRSIDNRLEQIAKTDRLEGYKEAIKALQDLTVLLLEDSTRAFIEKLNALYLCQWQHKRLDGGKVQEFVNAIIIPNGKGYSGHGHSFITCGMDVIEQIEKDGWKWTGEKWINERN